jgi:hypothetical protein
LRSDQLRGLLGYRGNRGIGKHPLAQLGITTEVPKQPQIQEKDNNSPSHLEPIPEEEAMD